MSRSPSESRQAASAPKKANKHWDIPMSRTTKTPDLTPVRGRMRKPTRWELALYLWMAVLWGTALWLILTRKAGYYGFTLLGLAVFGLRLWLFEWARHRRCTVYVEGVVEGYTRRRFIGKSTRFPVIRFEVNGQVYRAEGRRSCDPYTEDHKEWVYYNPDDPRDSFAAVDSNPRAARILTIVTGALGLALLYMELF